ncbi:MAG TPA: endonuclease III [Vicinamibacteria bacterium]|nr:endonuclease III [Vicinamibacteria bacterium]
MKRNERILAVLRRLARDTRNGRYREAPVYQGSFEATRSPFMELVACLISQRVRDETTTRVCAELFAIARTPEEILSLPRETLRRLLFGAGFYNQKSGQLRALARTVSARGGVPRTREGLLELPGIGPKCANLVLANCFGEPAIAVDTHVHRISNRMDWVRTETPERTEEALTPLVPTRWRRRVNAFLVAHGQLVCKPTAPRCEECRVAEWCRRRGVPPGDAANRRTARSRKRDRISRASSFP